MASGISGTVGGSLVRSTAPLEKVPGPGGFCGMDCVPVIGGAEAYAQKLFTSMEQTKVVKETMIKGTLGKVKNVRLLQEVSNG